MTEGMASLNQHVANTGVWERAERRSPLTEASAFPQIDLLGDQDLDRYPLDIRRTVEAHIIPRLLLARDPKIEAAIAVEGGLGEADVLHFAQLLLAHDDEMAITAHLQGVQARGFSIDHIYLHLFQPVARHIGDLWSADICTFIDVTLALGTMQKLLRTLGPAFHKTGRPADGARHALLVPLPGDQHTFGLSMVAEFFRRAGWNVWSTPFASRDDLTEAVETSWFAVVGFSASNETRLDELASTIRLVRRHSCNGAIGVLVGGPVFLDHPEYVTRVGADAFGVDAKQALDQAEGVLALRTGA